MKHVRVESDRTHTEVWSGHTIRNARRGFYYRGHRLWPSSRPQAFRPTVISDTADRRAVGSIRERRAERRDVPPVLEPAPLRPGMARRLTR